MTKGRPDSNIAKLAARAGGVFSHQQARDCGLTPRQIAQRVGTGIWTRALPGVYRHTATPASTSAMSHAALLWAGSNSVLSHRSAAAIWGLDGLEDLGQPEVTVIGTRHPRSRLITVHRTLVLAASDRCIRDRLRVTRPSRTIIDLASILGNESLEFALESGRRQRIVTIESIRLGLAQVGGPGRRGAAHLSELLARLDGTTASESLLEVKVARRLRATSLPAPTKQFPVRVFGCRYRLDFAWPKWRVALECDGEAFHEFQRDRARWRRLGAAGWRVLPVTWRDVTRNWPATMSELAAALADAA
jgi:very-short-patch-repair endonuclease